MTAAADSNTIATIKAELAECLAAEVAVWNAKQSDVIIRLLRQGPYAYEVVFKNVEYNCVADLLEQTEQYLHVMLDVQPEPQFAHIIAAPREPGSGGWTSEQMGMVSENFIIKYQP
ncbi:MAG: hypothetical protein ABL907_08940 [Hyphomicrobium sp.]